MYDRFIKLKIKNGSMLKKNSRANHDSGEIILNQYLLIRKE